MKIDDGNTKLFVRPASHSYHFLVGAVFILIDLTAATLLLVKRLNSMPFPTAAGLVAAMLALVWWWRLAFSRYEGIRIFMQGQGEPSPNPALAPVLRACADLIYMGLFLTALTAGMLLLAIEALRI